MRLHPKQIKHLGNSRYEVSIETEDPHGTYTFEFKVTGEDIRVVEYPPEFAELLKYNTGPTRNLLAAIKSFDMAQDLEVPISEYPDGE